MKFCFLNEAFKGNTYIPGDQPNEKPYGPFNSSTYTSASAVIPQEDFPDKSLLCNNVYEHFNACPHCKKHMDDIVEIHVRERLILEKERSPNNTLIIILFIVLIWWILRR
jgi:hypothetical protein